MRDLIVTGVQACALPISSVHNCSCGVPAAAVLDRSPAPLPPRRPGYLTGGLGLRRDVSDRTRRGARGEPARGLAPRQPGPLLDLEPRPAHGPGARDAGVGQL